MHSVTNISPLFQVAALKYNSDYLLPDNVAYTTLLKVSKLTLYNIFWEFSHVVCTVKVVCSS